MSKRLQVVVREEELERYARTADAAGVTLSEWARQALRAAELRQSSGDVEDKLTLIRKAAAHSFSREEPDIDTLLSEIDAGRLAEIEAGMADVGDA